MRPMPKSGVVWRFAITFASRGIVSAQAGLMAWSWKSEPPGSSK